MHEKTTLRALARELAARLDEKQARSDAMAQTLFTQSQYIQAQTFFCYAATAPEPDTSAIISHALSNGKRVFLPRCIDTEGRMEAVEIFQDTELIKGLFGIPEPPRNLPAAEPESFDLMVIPCVACSADMGRLGHGGGYYDRFFARCSGFKAVLCFDDLVFPTVPRQEYDVDPDMIITESRVLTAERK